MDESKLMIAVKDFFTSRVANAIITQAEGYQGIIVQNRIGDYISGKSSPTKVNLNIQNGEELYDKL